MNKIESRITFKDYLFKFLDENPSTSSVFKSQMQVFCAAFGREMIEAYFSEWKEFRKSNPPVEPILNLAQGSQGEMDLTKKPYGTYWWQDK